jgi:RHS repeat-associated protein
LRNGLTDTSTVLEDRAHNEANELTSFTTPTTTIDPNHDDAGNMIEGPSPTDPTVKHKYVYDAWNRLVKVTDASDVSMQENEYDGLNRRIVRDETGGSGELKHFYYNEEWQVLVEADPNDVATAMYSYHPEYIDAVAVRMRDADAHVYLQDANFNVTAVIRVDTGNVEERYSYTPYGEVIFLDSSFAPRSSSLLSNEILYTGRRLDPVTGLQINRNRFYASHLGRWVNRDPIGYRSGQTNLYGYVNEGPTNHTDPLGLLRDCDGEWADCVWDAIVARELCEAIGSRFCQHLFDLDMSACAVAFKFCEDDNEALLRLATAPSPVPIPCHACVGAPNVPLVGPGPRPLFPPFPRPPTCKEVCIGVGVTVLICTPWPDEVLIPPLLIPAL